MTTPITLQDVKSSMFSKVGYSEDSWVLTVIYKSSGLRLDYQEISPELFDAMMSSESIGKFFNAEIKGKYHAIGEEVSQQAGDKPLANVEGGLTEEDLKFFDEVTAKQEQVSGAPVNPETQVDCVDVYRQHPDGTFTEVKGGIDFGVQKFDPDTGHRPNSDMNEDGTVKMHVSEVAQFGFSDYKEMPTSTLTDDEHHKRVVEIGETLARAEVLAAWQPPENAVSAIIMLQEREPEINAMIAANGELSRDAMSTSVTDALSYASAGQTLKNLVEVKDRHFKLLDPIRAMLYQTYQAAGEKQKLALTCLDGAITYVKRVMVNFETEQERIRQQKIREENERREAEARRLQEEQSQQLTLAEIDDALEAGDTARAEELAASPIQVPKPYIPPVSFAPEVLPPAGQSTRPNWKCDEEDFDLVKFLTAVKSGTYPIDKAVKVIKPDFPALNKLAKALETAFDVPGFTAKNDPVKTVRRGK